MLTLLNPHHSSTHYPVDLVPQPLKLPQEPEIVASSRLRSSAELLPDRTKKRHVERNNDCATAKDAKHRQPAKNVRGVPDIFTELLCTIA